MDNQQPFVSVIMGVFNVAFTIRQAIQSIFDQAFQNYELIIIDDGSEDDTPDLIKKVKDERIILKSVPHEGLTKALNEGLRLSRGQLIARMDADDIALPERFRKQLRFLESNPKVGVVGTAYEVLTETGEKKIPRVPLLINDQEIRAALPKFNPFFHGSTMIRREVFGKIGDYDKRFTLAQDYDLWFRASRYYELANLSEVLMIRREGKMTVEKEAKQNWSGIKIRLKAIYEKNTPPWSFFYLIRPLLVAILPIKLKMLIRSRLVRSQ